MGGLVICKIAWEIAGVVGEGSFSTDISDVKKWTDIGNAEYGAGTHKMECVVPYTNKQSEFPTLIMPA